MKGEDEGLHFTHIMFSTQLFNKRDQHLLEIQSHEHKSRNELFGRFQPSRGS